MLLRALVLLALALPGVSLGATGQAAGKTANPAVSGNASPAVVTSTGSTTARTLAARFADVVNVKDFGAKGDGSFSSGVCSGGADNTSAIQAAINKAAESGGIVEIPPTAIGSCYRFTRVYFQYDAVNNPGFPSTSAQARGITVRGAGAGADTSASASGGRSLIGSSDATGPAFTINGGGSFAARQIVIDGLTLVASNSTSVVSLVNANTGIAIRNLTVQQGGSGGGIDWENPWVNSTIGNVLVQSSASSMTAGSFGLRVRSSVSGGGLMLDRVFVGRAYGAAGRFDIGIQLGGLPGETAYEGTDSYLEQVVGSMVTTQACNRGLVVGARVRGGKISGFYAENNLQHAIRITRNVGQFRIEGGNVSDPDASEEILIDAGAPTTPINNVEIAGLWFTKVYHYGVRFAGPGDTSGRVSGCRFTRYVGDGLGAHTAIQTGGVTTPWAFEDNTFDSFDGLIDFDDSTKVARRTGSDGSVYLAGKVSPGKGTSGSNGIWMGSGTPSSGLGADGDRYFQTDTPAAAYLRDYVKFSGAWVSLRTEPGGAAFATNTGTGTVNPDARTANAFVYTANAGVAAITVSTPSGANQGREITICYANGSGGASAATFDAAIFKSSGTLAPANGFTRCAQFIFQNSYWREIGRTTADVPN